MSIAEIVLGIVSVLCVPCISTLIYLRHMGSRGLLRDVCVYGAFTVVIRLCAAFPVKAFFKVVELKLEDGSPYYLLSAFVLSILLPYIWIVIDRCLHPRLEIKTKDEN